MIARALVWLPEVVTLRVRSLHLIHCGSLGTMDVASSIKRKLLVLFPLAVLLLLLLLHAISRQIPSAAGRAFAVDVDPSGVFNATELKKFVKTLRKESIDRMEASDMGTWAARKGLNMLASLSNGKSVFVKMRSKQFQLQGELYSYYLNCYLEMWNAPPTALACASLSDHQWIRDISEPVDFMKSANFTCFTATEYVGGLEDAVYVPERARRGLTVEAVATTPRELSRLLEWSDMIVFDYLCGHTDRLGDNLLPLVNFELHMKQVPNLARTSSGDLVLIDHEATFHDSYGKARASTAEHCKQLHYFKTVSVFRRKTIERACQLCSHKDPVSVLEDYIQDRDMTSLFIASRLRPEDRSEFKIRLSNVCDVTCHLLTSSENPHSTFKQ